MRSKGPLRATIAPSAVISATNSAQKKQLAGSNKVVINHTYGTFPNKGTSNLSTSQNPSVDTDGESTQTALSVKDRDIHPLDQDIESLFDDYLISELMRMNSIQNCDFYCQQVNREVVEMWSALEMLRGEVLAAKQKNNEMKTLLEFYEAVTTKCAKFDFNLRNTLPQTAEYLQGLADALEQSRHHLKVLGAEVDPNGNTESMLLQILNENNKLLADDQIKPDIGSLKQSAETITNLNEDLGNSLHTFKRCKELLGSLKTATYHSTSLTLSKQALQEAHVKELTKP